MKFPIKSLSIELTESCNYRCNMCDYWKIKNPSFISYNSVQEVLSNVDIYDEGSITITGGEPLLHPRWKEICDSLPKNQKKFLCTNGGSLLSHAKDISCRFNFVTVSIDGASKEKFFEIRRRDHFDRIFSGLSLIKEINPAIIIEVKFTIQKNNFRDIINFYEICRSKNFIDGICFGLAENMNTAFGKDVTNNNNSDEFDLNTEEILEFSDLVEKFYSSFDEQEIKRYLVEGDLRRFREVLRFRNGFKSLFPNRDCPVPKSTLILKSNGNLRLCYFLHDVMINSRENSSLGDVLFKARNKIDTNTNVICQNCEQCMVINPPEYSSYYKGEKAQ